MRNGQLWCPINSGHYNSPSGERGVVMVLPGHNWVLNIPADTLATQMTDNALAAFAAPAPIDVYAGYSIPFSVPTFSQWWSVPVALFVIHQIWAFRARRQQ
ncbi:MAG: hypothetical protein OSB70_14760 [Myxococcota bacterium]|nr:hypothetical protein [Myxococcota bacterium]